MEVPLNFKVGECIVFTNECINPDFRGFRGYVKAIRKTEIVVHCKFHPDGFNPVTPWVEVINEKDFNYIRKLTKLEKAMK